MIRLLQGLKCHYANRVDGAGAADAHVHREQQPSAAPGVTCVLSVDTVQILPMKVAFLHVLVPHMATAQQSLHSLFPV